MFFRMVFIKFKTRRIISTCIMKAYRPNQFVATVKTDNDNGTVGLYMIWGELSDKPTS